MDEQDAGRLAQALWEAIGAEDWEAVASYVHENFVQEWPQSGERIVGRDNAIAINRHSRGATGRADVRRR